MQLQSQASLRKQDFSRRNTLPELPERPRCSAVRTQLPPRDPTAALRALQMARKGGSPQDAVPPQATLGSLATMLMACSFLQVWSTVLSLWHHRGLHSRCPGVALRGCVKTHCTALHAAE